MASLITGNESCLVAGSRLIILKKSVKRDLIQKGKDTNVQYVSLPLPRERDVILLTTLCTEDLAKRGQKEC